MQKRKPAQQPEIISESAARPTLSFMIDEGEERFRADYGRQLSVGWNFLNRIMMFEPSDSYEACRLVFNTRCIMEDICAQGDLDALKAILKEIRSSTYPIMNRSTSWEFWDSTPRHLEKAYEHGHWHIIEYLISEPEFHIISLRKQSRGLPAAVADRALETNSCEDLQRMKDLGWNINDCTASFDPPALCRVTSNDNIVEWFLSRGADPNAPKFDGSPPMIYAAREASLASIKRLVSCGGQVKDTDLIAQAAIGHSWGRPGCIEVIDYLLAVGAPIDRMSASNWTKTSDLFPEMDLNDWMKMHYGGQTALNIARITGDYNLAKYLLAKGANPKIAPVSRDPVPEFID